MAQCRHTRDRVPQVNGVCNQCLALALEQEYSALMGVLGRSLVTPEAYAALITTIELEVLGRHLARRFGIDIHTRVRPLPKGRGGPDAVGGSTIQRLI